MPQWVSGQGAVKGFSPAGNVPCCYASNCDAIHRVSSREPATVQNTAANSNPSDSRVVGGASVIGSCAAWAWEAGGVMGESMADPVSEDVC